MTKYTYHKEKQAKRRETVNNSRANYGYLATEKADTKALEEFRRPAYQIVRKKG